MIVGVIGEEDEDEDDVESIVSCSIDRGLVNPDLG